MAQAPLASNLFIPNSNLPTLTKSGSTTSPLPVGASNPLQTLSRAASTNATGFTTEIFMNSNGSGYLTLSADNYLPALSSKFFNLATTSGTASQFMEFPGNGLWIVSLRIAITAGSGSVSCQGSNLTATPIYATFSSTTYNGVILMCNVANTTGQNSYLTLQGGGFPASESVGTLYLTAYQLGQPFSNRNLGGS